MTTEKTACILCSRNCGLEVDVEHGHLVRIRGDADHPISNGYMCQKAAHLDHYQNNEDRLRQPLKRMPGGDFQPVSWEEAIRDIAKRLLDIRERHGGRAFAIYGLGGQGNHLGAAYSYQILNAMGSRFFYTALAQEKTGDFWVNGRLFGRQTCHTTEDIDHSDFVIFIGTNPWQAHGIRNAREAIRELGESRERTMVVIDPRRTETAERADIHLQLKPGTDAFLLSAMLAIIVREKLFDRQFIERRTTGFAEVESELLQIPIEEFVRRADVPMEDVLRTVRGFARAKAACVRVDLGIQQSLHSTLNSYLEKLVFLLTGHFGKRGSNNFHTYIIPLIDHSSEDKPDQWRTSRMRMFPIGRMYPPNILPAEIDNDAADRIRAVIVDSANPVITGADTAAFEHAFSKLELLVVVDVAMTETARLAHYVLPASSQMEKWEMTGFNLEFPDNAFHLRHPLFAPSADTLPEPEIYTRILEEMGELPREFPVLERIARADRRMPKAGLFLQAFGATMVARRKLRKYQPSVLYRTFGRALPHNAAAAAPVWLSSHVYALRHSRAVRRAGHRGYGPLLGESLFDAILNRRSGTLISRHLIDEVWLLIKHRDGRVHLAIPEMLRELQALKTERDVASEFPFVLIAGERRAYNANTIYRDPAWRKQDPEGSMRIHPDDARELGLANGARAHCRSARGEIDVTITYYPAVRRGTVTLPHGYGTRYGGGSPVGPQLNRLTWSEHCDALTRTPFHKFVPVAITPVPIRIVE